MLFVADPSPLHPALLLAWGSAPVPVGETSRITALCLPASLHRLGMQIGKLKRRGVRGKGFQERTCETLEQAGDAQALPPGSPCHASTQAVLPACILVGIPTVSPVRCFLFLC